MLTINTPESVKDWEDLIDALDDQREKDLKDIKLENFKPENYAPSSLIAALDRVTAYSLFMSERISEWSYYQSQINRHAKRANRTFEDAMDDTRGNDRTVNKLLTTGRSWEERASHYRLNNRETYRINEAAKATEEVVKGISIEIRQIHTALRNLRDDLDLRIRMMTLQNRFSNAPTYD